MPSKTIQFFPGLNALRFFAALSVIVGHVELIKLGMGLDNLFNFSIKLNLGGLGVYFFFVLSGFLITYLLLKEKDKHNTISIKRFYLRRVFRIWPLYYLLVLLGFFVLPHIHVIDLPYYKQHFEANFGYNLLFYLLILPNVAFSIYSAVPHIGQSWSIGVEEQFYIFWPLLIKKAKNVGQLIIIAFVSIIILKATLLVFFKLYPQNQALLYTKNFLVMCRFESMMIGAYGAYLLFYEKQKILHVIYHPATFYFSLLSFLPINYIVFDSFIQDGIHLVLSVLFLIIILNISTNPTCKIKLTNSILEYLGTISYGLYMYHLMLIPVIVALAKNYLNYTGNGFIENSLVYLLSVLISVVFSAISYKYFESFFLKFKKKFNTS
jgi:peptidoglycan/LPS O-acetylase OafA/YrhL